MQEITITLFCRFGDPLAPRPTTMRESVNTHSQLDALSYLTMSGSVQSVHLVHPLTLRWETSLESISLVINRNSQHLEFTSRPHHLLPATY